LIYLLPIEDDENPPPANAWRLFTVSSDKDGNECTFLDEADALGDNLSDQFDSLLAMVRKLAAIGKPWKSLIPDPKDLHDIDDVKINLPSGRTIEEKIWQFKLGQIRIMWCYGGGNKVMVLTHTAVKKGNSTPKADIESAGKVMKAYFEAKELNQLKIVGDDHEHALHQLFAEKTGKPRIQKTGKNRRSRS
jgi:hypothetical protein